MVTTGVAAPGALLRLYLNGSFLASVTAGAKGSWSLTVEHGMTGGAYAIRADEIDRGKGAVISRAEVPFNYPQHMAETGAVAKPATPAEAIAAAPPAASSDQPKASAATALASAAPHAAAPAQPKVFTVSAAQPSAPPAASAAVQPPVASALIASAALTDASVQTAAPKPAPASGEALAGSPPPEPAANVVVKLIDTHKVVPGDNLWDISQHVYGDGLRYTEIYAANSNQIRNPSLIYPGQIFVLPQATPF
jgi:nucleoid-associated protein YgaU